MSDYKKFKISQIGRIVSGATPKTTVPDNYGGEIAWLTPADLSGYKKKYISHGARSITRQGYDSCSTELMPAGTVLFSSRAPIGYVAIAQKPVCTNQGFKSIIPNDNVDSEFLYYQLKHLKQLIQDLGSGTTFREISAKVFGNVEIVVPPMDEQKRIVTRIEELFSELDKAVETLNTTKQQLAVYRQAVLQQAFSGRFTGSEMVKSEVLGTFIEKPRYGTSKKCDYSKNENSTEVYRIPNINYVSGLIDHRDIKYASFSEGELKDLQLKKGDILIIRSNGSASLVGRAAVVTASDTNGTFAGYLMRLRIRGLSIMNPQFLKYYLSSHKARVYIENKAKSTSGVHNINSSEICGLEVPLFSYHEQEKIIASIETRLSVCDSILNTVDTALQQTEALRQSILKKAFEGRL